MKIRTAFFLLLFLGLLVRILLIGNTGFIADVSFWKSWSLAALDHGITWTTHNTNINYPPGFIYVLWLMGKFYTLFGDPHDYNTFWRENNFAFLFVSKSFAIASDVIIACLIYWFVNQKEKLKQLGAIIPLINKSEARNPKHETRRNVILNLFQDPKGIPDQVRNDKKNITNMYRYLPLILSMVFYLNPIVIMDSAQWGQVESFGILFTIIAILLFFYRKPLPGIAIFTIGVYMKLQNIIYIPIIFIFIARYFDLKTMFKSLGIFFLMTAVIALPFIIEKDTAQIIYLMTLNSDYFPLLSLNAHNIWWIVADGAGMKVSDKITVFLTTNAKTTGLLLFSATYFLSCLLTFLKPTARNFLVSLSTGIFAFFLFTAESHERYSYPVIVFLLLFYPFLKTQSSNIRSNIKDSRRSGIHDAVRLNNSSTASGQNSNLIFKIKNLFKAITLILNTGGTVRGTTDKDAARKIKSEYLSGVNRDRTREFKFGENQAYFWIIYTLLTITIFFNIHMGLILNYPENGISWLTALSTKPVGIINSYLLTLLYFLLLPFVFSQISKLYFSLPIILFIGGILATNSSYLISQKVSLTHYKPVLTRQDFAHLQINKTVNSYNGWKSWNRLSNNYFYYRKGFGTRANSNQVFDINRKYSRFTTDMGVETEAGTQASVIFKIYGDGVKLFESAKMGRFDFPTHADIDVKGIKFLGLVVEDAGDGINNDHAGWYNPILYK